MTDCDTVPAMNTHSSGKDFEQLYADHHLKIYANIYGIVRDSDLAADILQEVFISLWLRLRAGDIKVSVLAWLFVVSRNMCIACLKTQKKEVTLSGYPDSSAWPEDSTLAEVHENHELKMKKIYHALPLLSPRRRQAFVLNKLHGRPIDDVAAMLKTKPSTVREYLKQSLRILRKQVSAASERDLN
jgi:RNA polymerase sigma-70 factor (ECF subfamily)